MMPKASLPTTTKGWIAALVAAFVGFISGFAVLACLNRWWR